MADIQYLTPLFGISVYPSAQNAQLALTLTQVADNAGFDFVTAQDHPYNATFLDTWTLLSVLGARTQHVRLMPNVANLPLRPPAMLAKAAATLDILTKGRFEMGLGAGAFWEGVAAYGGPTRAPGEAVSALEEAIALMRAVWQPPTPGQSINFSGQFYSIRDLQPGPAPAHPIGIWIGGYRPRMLQLIGRLADGWIVSASYVPPENVPALQENIDSAAQSAGRSPTAIRRAYNIAGTIMRPGSHVMIARRKGIIVGSVAHWIEELTRYYQELRIDTFIFWPIGDEEDQVRLFADEIIPAVKAAIKG